MNGTSWLLGGGYPWYSGDPAADRAASTSMGVIANQRLGLSLAALTTGPLGLGSPDGSLGRLTLPLGVAVDGEDVFILSKAGDRIYRYEAVTGTLVPLAEIGAEGLGPNPPAASFTEPRRFQGATNIAAGGGLLYVADAAEHRVQVFEIATLALVRIDTAFDDVADVATGQLGVYVLDRKTGKVHRSSPRSESFELVIDAGKMDVRWDRLAVDRSERIYLRDSKKDPPTLDAFTLGARPPATAKREQFTNSMQVRDRFRTPEIHVDGRGGIILPARLLDRCGLRTRWDAQTRWWPVGDRLYVIDSRERVVRVHFSDGRLRHRFGPYDAPDGWSPVDLVALPGCVLILDERHQLVYAHEMGAESLQKWFAAPPDHPRRWSRIARDASGCVLLWDGSGEIVDRVDLRGRLIGQVPEREVRRQFVRDASAKQPADRQPARFTREGTVPRAAKEPPQWSEATFEPSGVWTSRWLDSDLYNCQWHVIEMRVNALPPGSRLVVRTRTSNEKESDAEVQAAITPALRNLGSWREVPALVGVPQPDEQQSKPRDVDVLVPSGPGRFIQLQLELTGDGVRTPVVGSLRLRFPRESLLEYLPAIYSKPEEQREFLDRFLAIMQTTWSAIERGVDTFHRYLDPDSVPADGMAFLAGWLDLRLEGTWKPEQNRRLLQAMPKLRQRWGTPDGISAWLRVYLANLGGVEPEQLEAASIPGIVESFVDRRRLMLNRSDTATLGVGEGLWSPSVFRRFQVGVYDREGDVELVSAGNPERDVFAQHASSFRVYLPAAFVRTADEEALIRRAIELQKPAHTAYELVLVEPRFRIGDQSTIGLDTVVGAPLPGPLVCPTVDDPPSRPVYQRLGFDTTLGGNGGHDAIGIEGRSLA